MKELSIEEKAKAYDEAIEVAREYWNSPRTCIDINVLPKLFPELKESEDEEIRKEMIEILKKESHDFPSSIIAEKSNSWVAWLEKQGAELSVYQNVLFKIATILSQHEDKEDSPLEQIRSIVVDGLVSAMDIDKQGEQKPEEIVNLHDYLYGEQKPVSIEMKTPEESLGIDSETYNKIIDECIYGNKEQKPAWSEEDEKEVAVLEAYIRSKDWSDRHIVRALGIVDELVKKLKSLNLQNTWKPSDEQLKALETTLYTNMSRNDERYSVLSEFVDEIKKLREE